MVKRLTLINIAAAVAALLLPIVLASLAVRQAQFAITLSAMDEASVHGYGDIEKACLEWTDSCRTCRRAGDTVTCSNIGIACQPKPITCVRREEAPKPPEAAPKQDGAPK
jgi:hypothetical protein